MNTNAAMSALREFFATRCGSGEIITIAYAGGHTPAAAREIVAVKCDDQLLVATEPASAISKTFRLDKIMWAEAGGTRVENQRAPPPHAPFPLFQTLREYVEFFRAAYEPAGWNFHQSDDSFGVGGFFKNGKPRKTAMVAIAYYEPTDLIFNPDSGAMEAVTRAPSGHDRPWRVDSWRLKQGRTFGSVSAAAQFFHEEVLASDPHAA